MKLVEILARELKAWPSSRPDSVGQAIDGTIYYLRNGSGVCYARSKKKYTQHSESCTAIVTRKMWEAERAKLKADQAVYHLTEERAKLKAPKANGDGWIRHRGGKCPVDAGVLVDVKHRDGKEYIGVKAMKYPALDMNWLHDTPHKAPGEIMRYRIHKPAEQPDEHDLERAPKPAPVNLPEGYGQVVTATLDSVSGPLEWRDRIRELDTQRAEVESTYQRQISEITQARESLVQKLAGEGLALVEVAVQPVEEILDWTDWKIGDVLTSTADGVGYTSGRNYKFLGMTTWGTARTLDDDGKENGMMPVCFAWHSRPAI